MEKNIQTSVPVTVHLETTPCQRVVVLKDGKIYYDRPFSPAVEKFKFNLPDTGNFCIKLKCEKVKSEKLTNLERAKKVIVLPAKEKTGSKLTGYEFVYRPDLKGTPAAVNVKSGIIMFNDKFKSFPFYAQKFIIQHELGHRFYKTEHFCDVYAAKRMIDMGYNLSSCIMAMRNTLSRSETNIKRIEDLFGAIES